MAVHLILFSNNSRKYYIIYRAEPDIRILKVGPWPHLGPNNISKGRARALLGPCHATPLATIDTSYTSFKQRRIFVSTETRVVRSNFIETSSPQSHVNEAFHRKIVIFS